MDVKNNNNVTLKELVLTNPYRNMRIVPGDKMIIIGEIFIQKEESLGKIIPVEDDGKIFRDFNNEYDPVNTKSGLRRDLLEMVEIRLKKINKQALEFSMNKKAKKMNKLKGLIKRI